MNEDRNLSGDRIGDAFGLTPDEVKQLRQDVQYCRISAPVRVVIIRGDRTIQESRTVAK